MDCTLWLMSAFINLYSSLLLVTAFFSFLSRSISD